MVQCLVVRPSLQAFDVFFVGFVLHGRKITFFPPKVNLLTPLEISDILRFVDKMEILTKVLTSPEEIQAEIRKELVPMAIEAYKVLLNSPDEVIRKKAADTVFGMVDVKESKASGKIPPMTLKIPQSEEIEATLVGLKRLVKSGKDNSQDAQQE